jgi:ABC-type lipoprotein export system ATPase subunit
MLISCQNLQKQYTVDNQPILAADDINLDISENDFLTILGHSGSGKTTLLSLIGGLTMPDSGKVLVHGKDVWIDSDAEISRVRNETIGFIFQFASLIPTLTVHENLLLPLSFGETRKGSSEKADALLEEVGIADKRNSFPAELSGGQQRRVAIARAFMNNPQIVLADEPTGDLDEATEKEIMKFFYRRHEQGVTFVIVTHNSNLARGHKALRVLNMKNGQLQEQ